MDGGKKPEHMEGSPLLSFSLQSLRKKGITTLILETFKRNNNLELQMTKYQPLLPTHDEAVNVPYMKHLTKKLTISSWKFSIISNFFHK